MGCIGLAPSLEATIVLLALANVEDSSLILDPFAIGIVTKVESTSFFSIETFFFSFFDFVYELPPASGLGAYNS